MPKFAANLTMLFQDRPFMERFDAAAAAGFDAVEFLFPYEYPVEDLKAALKRNNLKVVLFNLPAGNWAAGDRGIAVDPSRKEEFAAGVETALQYAKELGVPRMNCLAGKKLSNVSEAEQHQTLVQNLQLAADRLATLNIQLLVEHINYRDIPGFALNTTAQVLSVLDEVNRPNAFLQYDIYHAQRMEGELVNTYEKNKDRIAHIQIADNPGRHEPGTGEVNYRFVFAALDRLGYTGHIGLEYIPSGDTVASFKWIKEYGF